jgi:NAD(P)-dependent dehydrogenase (short-subunit alcohol dehydrogenase family)
MIMSDDRPVRGSTPDPAATTDDVLAGRNLSGCRVLITGASSGLGVETVRALAGHGADLVVAVRDPAKTGANLSAAGVPAGHVTVREVDLASLESIRALTDAVSAEGLRFDVIIANAGVMACPQGRTLDGFETQFGTNHLGHFLLVNRLAQLIRDGGRVVVLSSAGHRHGDVDLQDPNFASQPYHPWLAYGRSKTANALFAVDFDRRHRNRGIRGVAVHPGAIATELNRHLTAETIAMLRTARASRPRIALKSVSAGAATTAWAVVADGDEVGGRYCEDCAVSPVITDPDESRGVMAYAVDPARAEALAELSAELVGEQFAGWHG